LPFFSPSLRVNISPPPPRSKPSRALYSLSLSPPRLPRRSRLIRIPSIETTS
jgi:hypothetical protein